MSDDLKETLNSLRRNRIDLIHKLDKIDKAIHAMEEIIHIGEPHSPQTRNDTQRRADYDYVRGPSKARVQVNCQFSPCGQRFVAKRSDAKGCCKEHTLLLFYESHESKRPLNRKKGKGKDFKSPYAWPNVEETMRRTGIAEDKISEYMKKNAGKIASALAVEVKYEAVVRTHNRPVTLLPGDALSKKDGH